MEKMPQPEPFDQEWYDRFVEHGSFQAYEYLNGDAQYRKGERAKFEAGEIDTPTLDYPKLNRDELDQKEQALLQLKTDILSFDAEGVPNQEKMEVVKQVYHWRLNEKIAETRMLQAAESGNMRRFERYSKFIYGKPSPEIFSYTINSLRQIAEKQLNAENHDLQIAAQEFHAVLPVGLPEPTIAALPSEDTVSFANTETLKELGDLITVPESEGEIDAAGIQAAFESALGSLRTEGWKVVIDPNRSSIAVSQEQKTVQVPSERRMKTDKLKGLILHEIGTHVARREKGERTTLRLLGLGLDRYEGGEEGVATMREQALKKNVGDFAGLGGHLAISLAQGLDGTPRNFREVYTVLNKYYLFDELNDGQELSKAREAAARIAWNQCVRTFRGTDCKTPGAAFTKDIIYREGNIGVWELLRTNPNEMKRFNVGKYDPTNPRHLWVLTQLGISEEDLTSLAENHPS